MIKENTKIEVKKLFEDRLKCNGSIKDEGTPLGNFKSMLLISEGSEFITKYDLSINLVFQKYMLD